MIRPALYSVFSLSLLVAAAAPAIAQTTVREACMADIKKFCSAELAALDRDKVRVCLRINIAKTSPTCQAAAKAQMAKRRAN